MAKKIVFQYGDKEYTLAFTRASITKMEADGFVASDIGEKPMSRLPQLFAGAFLAHHPFVKRETVNDILDHMKDKQGLYASLGEMYGECIKALIDDPEESEGNVTWEMQG